MDLHQVQVARPEPGLLVRVGRGVPGHLRRSDHGAEEDVAVGVGLRTLL